MYIKRDSFWDKKIHFHHDNYSVVAIINKKNPHINQSGWWLCSSDVKHSIKRTISMYLLIYLQRKSNWFDLKCCFSIFLCKTICVFQQLAHVEVSNPFDKYQILFREISKLSLVQQSLHLINVFSKIQNPWQIFKVSLQSEDLVFPQTKYRPNNSLHFYYC
jgi:hypothetical protein